MDLFINWGSMFLGFGCFIIAINFLVGSLYKFEDKLTWVITTLFSAGFFCGSMAFFIIGLRGVL